MPSSAVCSVQCAATVNFTVAICNATLHTLNVAARSDQINREGVLSICQYMPVADLDFSVSKSTQSIDHGSTQFEICEIEISGRGLPISE